MPLTVGQMNFVTRVQKFALLLRENYGEIVTLNALWYGSESDYDTAITTAGLLEVPSLANLTANDLNELMYIIGNLKTLVDGRLEQIAVLTE